MTPHTREELVSVRSILIEVASSDGKISYTDLTVRAGIHWDYKNPNDRNLLSALLGAVSHHEYTRGRPLLTAVVVRKDSDEPGEGFLGLEGFPKTRDFWLIELKRVHDFWRWPQD